jgi:hypothetical protein
MRGPLDINPNADLSSDYRSSAGGGAAPVTSSAGTGDSPVTGPYKPQTVMGSLKKIGGGASRHGTGNIWLRAYDEPGSEYGNAAKICFHARSPYSGASGRFLKTIKNCVA